MVSRSQGFFLFLTIPNTKGVLEVKSIAQCPVKGKRWVGSLVLF